MNGSTTSSGGVQGGPAGPPPLRVGNCSGFYGDRLSALREQLAGGDLDVLTGDYLAELTMLILGRDRKRDASLGYARTFVRQLEDGLGTALERGVRIVANAGGLNPHGCADAVRRIARGLGLDVAVAVVDGDDLTARADELGLGRPLAANAYLGAFGIARACAADADVVVTGRVTDASLVVGPAIARFGWGRGDVDPIAGAMAAGHVLECGAQATGGNYAFFTELPDLLHAGFPVAEIDADGSSVVTKAAGTGGAVTVETVTSQLLYEIQDLRYAGPDAVLRLDSIELTQEAPDRVRIHGVRGEAPPPQVKVSRTTIGGYRNEMTFVLTGLDIDAKAELTRRQVVAALGPDHGAELTWTLARTDHDDPDTQERAAATLGVVARAPEEGPVGRAFSSAAVEIALATYPGCFLTTPPGRGGPYGVFSPGYVDQDVPEHAVTLPDGTRHAIEPPPATTPLVPWPEAGGDPAAGPPDAGDPGAGETVRVPLGRIVGARSGDKGGDANVGVWARDDAAFAWLERFLTTDRLRELLPEVAPLEIRRVRLPRLRALNFVVVGLLGEGVASGARFDPQAKALGEWLRARRVDVPRRLAPAGAVTSEKERP